MQALASRWLLAPLDSLFWRQKAGLYAYQAANKVTPHTRHDALAGTDKAITDPSFTRPTEDPALQ